MKEEISDDQLSIIKSLLTFAAALLNFIAVRNARKSDNECLDKTTRTKTRSQNSKKR
jgi:hypothetical protein